MPAKHVPSAKSLTTFKVLSFDVFGTLIDWETGIYDAYQATKPFSNLPENHKLRERQTLLAESERLERVLQVKDPSAEYAEILSGIYAELVREYELSTDGAEEGARSFGNSVGKWPVFSDTLEALVRLKQHYHLVPLTNSSPNTFGASIKGPFRNFAFSARYLATEIGSYKPDLRNFEYLFKHVKEDFGVEKENVLHVAQSLHHDHAPANKVGLTSAWIDRKGVMGESDVAEYAWKFDTLGELADAVDEAFAEAEK